MLQQLIEETGGLYDGFAFLVGELWRSSGQRNHSPTFIVGGLFFCSDGSQTCFGQECLSVLAVLTFENAFRRWTAQGFLRFVQRRQQFHIRSRTALREPVPSIARRFDFTTR